MRTWAVRRATLFGMAMLLGSLAMPGVAEAKPTPLFGFELRANGGASLGAASGTTVWKPAGVQIAALGEYTLYVDPRITVFIEITFEGLHSGFVGAGAGFHLYLDHGVRLGAGALALIAPSTRGGALVTIAECGQLKAVRLCGEIEWDIYFLGNDLAQNAIGMQLRAGLAVGFDTW